MFGPPILLAQGHRFANTIGAGASVRQYYWRRGIGSQRLLAQGASVRQYIGAPISPLCQKAMLTIGGSPIIFKLCFADFFHVRFVITTVLAQSASVADKVR